MRRQRAVAVMAVAGVVISGWMGQAYCKFGHSALCSRLGHDSRSSEPTVSRVGHGGNAFLAAVLSAGAMCPMVIMAGRVYRVRLVGPSPRPRRACPARGRCA